MFKGSVAEQVSAIYPKILRLAQKFDKQEPEDLAQSVTLNLLSHPERVPEQREISTAWVQRVVRNASLDAYRQRRRLVRLDANEQSEGEAVSEDAGAQIELATASPEREIDMRLDLLAAMSDLSEAQRDTMLRRADGESCEEIAAAEHTKVGTVRSRIHYASKTILPKLKGSAAEDFASKDIPPEQPMLGAILRFVFVALVVLTICALLLLRVLQ